MMRFRYPRMAITWMLLADRLGSSGHHYRDRAIEDLKTIASHAYDPASNTLTPMLIDGTRLDPAKMTKPGYYFDPNDPASSNRLRKRKAGPIYFRAYAMAWRASGGQDQGIWEMTRTLARKHKLGDLGDSAVNWAVRVWVKSEDYWSAKEQLTAAVKNHLDQAGIGIPFPQMDVHLFKSDD